ncbi:MAG: hypothetical protein C4557_13325 [Anaerolineaceae bacterium]|jgi:hypothetical protein|nr:MAG: hypothetical protein C4557_13325 [Anaerolineaceae bacterium]
MRRNQLFWGVVLLLLGGSMLANAMGITLPNGNSLMSLFWPLLLIGFGIWVLVGVFLRGGVETETASIDLQGATEASVKVNHGAGELRIHSGAGGNELVRGTFVGGLDHKAFRNGNRLEVRMRPAKDFMDFPFFGSRARLDWDVALNADVPTSLHLSLGANKSVIDLQDMSITNLKFETGASETELKLPSRGRFHADLDLGAASLTLVIPEGLSARIRASLGAADLKIDESRFPRNGAYYQSPDFDTAANTADITIDAGAASIKIK